MEQSIKSICIDTLTSVQEKQLAADKRKPGHDQWRDYGIGIVNMVDELQARGFETVLILGKPGVGKSSGMRTLETKTNIWYNADKKNPTWLGGTKEYGKKHDPTATYHQLPNSYDDILNHIDKGIAADMFTKQRVAFLTGHVENYKSGGVMNERLQTLGKMANGKMQVEGKFENVLFATVTKNEETGDTEYLLETQNNGYNTARSHQGMLDGMIPNDYNLILNAIIEY